MIDRVRDFLGGRGDRTPGRDGIEEGGAGADPIVSIEGVTVRLNGVTALDGVSASVDRGQFVGLVGPNGAGKTTLLRTVTGALSPDHGSVAVEGSDVSGLSSRAVSRKVAVVPQNTSLAFDFDVRELVAMGRTPYRSRLDPGDRADRSVVDTAMAQTDVARFADRSITEVSGGERQRVLLARALTQDTPVLLLDEPTASLDINHQRRTLELVDDLRDAGKTVVAAIHDLNLAAEYCDELLLLADGDVVVHGSPETVLTEAAVERAFDTEAVVTRHPVTGAVYVSAIPDDAGAERAATVHVVGGGGSATPVLYDLGTAGYTVSFGAVPEGDADLEAARSLDLETITVEPFSPVDAATREAVASKASAADATILADVEIREGNLATLEALRSVGPLLVVEDRPLAERNHAGAAGRRLYESLRERGTVVTSTVVRDAVRERIDSEAGAATDGESIATVRPDSTR